MIAERRERLTEMFIAFRDGYVAVRVGGDKLWPEGLPWYARSERGPKTGEDLLVAFGHLVRPSDEVH